MLTPTEEPLFRLLADLEHSTLMEWRQRYAPSLTLEGAMSQRIRTVTTTSERRPGGNITVTISVTAKKAFECEVNVFHLQRAGNKLYKKAEPASRNC